jgi:hypothetical protein
MLGVSLIRGSSARSKLDFAQVTWRVSMRLKAPHYCAGRRQLYTRIR